MTTQIKDLDRFCRDCHPAARHNAGESTELPPMYHGPEHFLEHDANANRLLTHARLLVKLTRRFEAIAPAGLRHSVRVANFKAGKIVIYTDNGAAAAKLRQMSQRLCSEMSKGGLECSELEVKVKPRQPIAPGTTHTPKPLSGKTFDLLRSTAENLPKGGLRDALDTLLKRALKAE